MLLFEAILNSKISKFYFGVRYRLRREGNFPKVNLNHLKALPIPNLQNKEELIKEIVALVSKIHKDGFVNHQELQTIDDFVFRLYSLDYYAIQQIYNYFTLEDAKDYIVTNRQIKEYCDEFIATFQPFLKQDLLMNARWNVSDFFGTIVEFNISRTKLPFKPNDRELEKHSLFLDKEKVAYCDKDRVSKEDKVIIYNEESLLIYKANKHSNWTKFIALQDANNEIGLFFQSLQGQKSIGAPK